MPKFVSHDIPLFQGILSDLFQDVKIQKSDYAIFTAAAKKVCSHINLQLVNTFLEKIIQTYEMMLVHHGIILMGEPYSGKTKILTVLAETLNILNDEGKDEKCVIYETVNPKSVTLGKLFGEFDPASHQWTDGIIANIFHIFASDTTLKRKWVIFDGPVDSSWVERMSTALDESRKLCLMNEIIKISPLTSFIFEVMDLSQVSPAIIGRCGIIYVESSTLGLKPLITSWINSLPESWKCGQEEFIEVFCNWLIPICIRYIKKNSVQLISLSENHLLYNVLELVLMMMMKDSCKNENKILRSWLTGYFIFAIVWGIGGMLELQSREKFSYYIKQIVNGKSVHYIPPEKVGKLQITLPSSGSLYDYIFETKGRGGIWKNWTDLLPSIDHLKTSMPNLIVPTVEAVQCSYFLDISVLNGRPVMLVGPTGTGKSTFTQDFLINKLPKDSFVSYFISFSSQTTAGQVQEIIKSKLDKRSKGKYGPSIGKKCIIFIDDINMPIPDKFGAQPPIELLRQYLDHKFWYELKTNKNKLYVHDVQFVAAMQPPDGNRYKISSRLLRHFCTFGINKFNDEALNRIFSTFLDTHFVVNKFPSEVFSVKDNLMNATVKIYKECLSCLLPIPIKPHYAFNLRDFFKVIQGLFLLKKQCVTGEKIFVRLWVHEVYRVFGDRLIDDNDCLWFFRLVKQCVQTCFNEDFDNLFSHLIENDENSQVTNDNMKNLMFGNFMDTDLPPEEWMYKEIKDVEAFKTVTILCLKEYNRIYKTQMDFTVFSYALEHLARVARIMIFPRGNALLVGASGTGKKSIAKLASVLVGHLLFQPKVTRNYKKEEWHEDLKFLFKTIGLQRKHTIFLISDNQIKEENFLGDINNLLNSSEVFNLFNTKDTLEAINLIRPILQAKDRTIDYTPLELFSSFLTFCYEHLHIVITVTPIRDAFHACLLKLPSVVNCCTIDWFEKWPDEALEVVALRSFRDLNISPKLKFDALEVCKYFHKSAEKLSKRYFAECGRHVYVTSSHYLNLIESFKLLLEERQIEVAARRDSYKGSFHKLVLASQQISEMKTLLEELHPKLEMTANEIANIIIIIGKKSSDVKETNEIICATENIAKQQATTIQLLKEEYEADLQTVLPALEAAVAAFDAIKPVDITALKSIKTPPVPLKLVMTAMCILTDVEPFEISHPREPKRKTLDYWGPSIKVLGSANFLGNLKDFQKDDIPPSSIAKVRKECINKPEFKLKNISKDFPAVRILFKWIIAIEQYDKVYKETEGKRMILQKSEAKLNEIQKELENKYLILQQVKKEIECLQGKVNDMKNQKVSFEAEIDLCKVKITTAEKLINGLGAEEERWRSEVKRFEDMFENLPGDVLLSSAVITYLGPYTASFREEFVKESISCCMKHEFPCSKDYSLEKALGNPLTVQEWKLDGLPCDNFSVDNALIINKTCKWPLIIDSQGQAFNWIKNIMKEKEFRIIKSIDADLFPVLEKCIKLGIPVLIENFPEEYDLYFDIMFFKQTFKQDGMEMIKLGDATVEFNPNFRLYIFTNIHDPHFLPKLTNKITLVNFMVTEESLEDKLLCIVATEERPNIERERNQLLTQMLEYGNESMKMEETILKTLCTKKNILQDETSIQELIQSKASAESISSKQKIAETAEKKTEKSLMDYKPVAVHASVLFFSIASFRNIQLTYEYSLNWFLDLFITSVRRSNKSSILEKRLHYLKDHFTYNLYCNICRSLFGKDRLTFSFLSCVNILSKLKQITDEEFQFFLTGGINLEKKLSKPKEWIPDNSWEELCKLAKLPSFYNFITSFQDHLQTWQDFYNNKEPHKCVFPFPWNHNLSEFQKLMLIRCLRPDKVVPMVVKFIENNLGPKFTHLPSWDLESFYNDSNQITPLLLILVPGVDPLTSLLKFGESKGFGNDKFSIVSLGQDQGSKAERLIEKARETGSWILLQNCHLLLSWMPHLELICKQTTIENTHKNYRLWLTTYPSDKIELCTILKLRNITGLHHLLECIHPRGNHLPLCILQKSIKMVVENPIGLRNNLLQSYLNDPIRSTEFFSSDLEGKENNFQKLVYSLCFFHAIVQGRKEFGPIGWNIPYEFDESDLTISLSQLKTFIKEYDDVPFEAIFYMVGECNYGGKVTDEWDRQCLRTILEDFCNKDIIQEKKHKLDPSNHYYIPSKMNYEEYVNFIKKLPSSQDAEVFGLHTNADISRELHETKYLFSSILSIQGKKDKTVDVFGDPQINIIITDILNKLPPLFNIIDAKIHYPVKKRENLNAILIQEIERYNKLLSTIQTSLQSLQDAIKGKNIMSESLEEIAVSLLTGKVPELWLINSYPSVKPLASYISDFCECLNFFQTWLHKGKPNVFWLPAFNFMHSFLTEALQNHVRRHGIPINLLAFNYEMLKSETSQTEPTDGIYISGLFLEGARWDRDHNILVEPIPRTFWDNMPIIWFKPCLKTEINERNHYKAPLYKTSKRYGVLSTTGHSTNYILPILLPTRKPAQHWIKRGTALLCQLDH